jgi:hypothetical protein
MGPELSLRQVAARQDHVMLVRFELVCEWGGRLGSLQCTVVLGNAAMAFVIVSGSYCIRCSDGGKSTVSPIVSHLVIGRCWFAMCFDEPSSMSAVGTLLVYG